MLRMGRSPRNEQTEQPQTQPPPAQQFNTPAQTAQQTLPPPAQTPAPQAERAPAQASAAPQRALSESEALARDIKEGVMSGFVGGSTVLTGEANFKGMLRVDGHLSGRVTSEKGTLIVSSGGRVDADISVANAKINGVVNGDITATERIEFGRSAQVRGNIQTPTLVIEQGAIFEGGCRMTQARAETSKAQKPSTTTQPSEPTQTQSRPRVEKSESKSGETPVPSIGVAASSAKPDTAAVSTAVS